MEVNYFLSQIVNAIISFFVLWQTSKFLKFKRNTADYAFLFIAIMFVLGSIFQIFFISLIKGISYTALLFAILIMCIQVFLWFYLIMKIYKISSKQAWKVAAILFIVGLITIPLISLVFPYTSPFKLPSTENLSCEERYSTFPLSGLSEDQKGEGLQTCLTNQAIDENNPLICEKTVSSDSCYSRYAINKKNETFCEKLPENIKYNCYFSIARDKNDETICENLPKESHFGDVSTCKFHVNLDIEVLRGNLNYCKSIEIYWEKDYCYLTFAKAKLDTSLCNNIEHEELNSIQSCIDAVNKWKGLQKEGKSLPEYYWA